MRKKFSIKQSLGSFFSNFASFNVEDEEEQEYIDYEENDEEVDDDIDEIEENYEDESESNIENELEDGKKKKKKKLKRKKRRKNKQASSLKNISKKTTKRRKAERPKMIFFIGTLLLLIATLFVYCVAYLLSPTFTLSAEISVVYGGYNIEYAICERPIHYFQEDVKVGDEFYFTPHGMQSNTSRNSIKLKVVEITDDVVYLDFVASGVPKFISTKDMKSLIVTGDNGKQISKILIKGKVVANRFSLLEIST